MRIKIEEGDIFKIKLTDGRFTFGRVLPDTLAFYDYVTSQSDDIDMGDIVSSPIICKLWVTEYGLKKKIWEVIGNKALEAVLKETVVFYKQDPINNKVWKTLTGGDEASVSVEECLNLEVASVWDPEHVVERLDCFFTGIEDLNLRFKKDRLLNKGISTQ